MPVAWVEQLQKHSIPGRRVELECLASRSTKACGCSNSQQDHEGNSSSFINCLCKRASIYFLEKIKPEALAGGWFAFYVCRYCTIPAAIKHYRYHRTQARQSFSASYLNSRTFTQSFKRQNGDTSQEASFVFEHRTRTQDLMTWRLHQVTDRHWEFEGRGRVSFLFIFFTKKNNGMFSGGFRLFRSRAAERQTEFIRQALTRPNSKLRQCLPKIFSRQTGEVPSSWAAFFHSSEFFNAMIDLIPLLDYYTSRRTGYVFAWHIESKNFRKPQTVCA